MGKHEGLALRQQSLVFVKDRLKNEAHSNRRCGDYRFEDPDRGDQTYGNVRRTDVVAERDGNGLVDRVCGQQW